jgi:hypothetical protein
MRKSCPAVPILDFWCCSVLAEQPTIRISASAEGTLQGTTNEVGTNANGVTESLPFLLSMIDELGGPRTYNHCPVGWRTPLIRPCNGRNR